MADDLRPPHEPDRDDAGDRRGGADVEAGDHDRRRLRHGGARSGRGGDAYADEADQESFPASDPPGNWSGPPT